MTALDKLYRKPTQSLTSWRDEVITVANTGRSLTEKQYREMTHYTFLRGLGTFPQMLNWVGERDSEETLQSCYDLAKLYEREIGTPGVAITRPSRVSAVSTVTDASVSAETVDVSVVSSHQMQDPSAPNSALGRVIKASQETHELIEKMKKELEQVKKRSNSRWRGGRGRGRGGHGRGGMAFGFKKANSQADATKAPGASRSNEGEQSSKQE